MQSLMAFPDDDRRAVRGVLLDIDDTLTTDGWLTAEAFAALAELRTAGKLVVPVTGRPAGWCDHMARMGPVDAIVGENGAFYFRYDHDARRMTRRYHADGDAIDQIARLMIDAGTPGKVSSITSTAGLAPRTS